MQEQEGPLYWQERKSDQQGPGKVWDTPNSGGIFVIFLDFNKDYKGRVKTVRV